MKILEKIALILLLLGGINWGLVGLFQFNVVDYVFGQMWVDWLIYVAIGFSALYVILNWQKIKKFK